MISMTTNMWANNAYRHMGYHTDNLGKSLERLASTKKLNSAADNPAGIGIYQRWQSRLGGLAVGMENAQNGISMLQAANTSADSIYSLLNDALDLAIDAQDGTLQPEQRSALNSQFQSKMAAIGDLANTTNYNSHYLLNQTAPPSVFDLGAAAQAGSISVSVDGNALTEDAGNGFSVAGDQITLNGSGVPDYWDEVEFGFTASAATPAIQLGAQPNSASQLEVRVNGTLVNQSDTDGWQLNGSQVTFTGASVPQAGDQVSMNFRTGGSHYPIKLQLGAVGHSSERISLDIPTDLRPSALNIDTEEITTINTAEDAETAIRNAVDTVTDYQASLGSQEDFLTNRITAMQQEAENISDASSRLSDADMTVEIVNKTLNEAMAMASSNVIATASNLQTNLLSILGIIPG